MSPLPIISTSNLLFWLVEIFAVLEDSEKGDGVTHGMDDLKRKMAARGGELKPEDLLS